MLFYPKEIYILSWWTSNKNIMLQPPETSLRSCNFPFMKWFVCQMTIWYSAHIKYMIMCINPNTASVDPRRAFCSGRLCHWWRSSPLWCCRISWSFKSFALRKVLPYVRNTERKIKSMHKFEHMRFIDLRISSLFLIAVVAKLPLIHKKATANLTFPPVF